MILPKESIERVRETLEGLIAPLDAHDAEELNGYLGMATASFANARMADSAEKREAEDAAAARFLRAAARLLAAIGLERRNAAEQAAWEAFVEAALGYVARGVVVLAA